MALRTVYMLSCDNPDCLYEVETQHGFHPQGINIIESNFTSEDQEVKSLPEIFTCCTSCLAPAFLHAIEDLW